MNQFTLIFIGFLLIFYGFCRCEQFAKDSKVDLLADKNVDKKFVDNSTVYAVQLGQIDRHNRSDYSTSIARTMLSFNETALDLRPPSLDNLLDRMYKQNDLTLNSTQFREMNVIDKEKDMQTAAGHKHHKVVEHHHHHHHGMKSFYAF